VSELYGGDIPDVDDTFFFRWVDEIETTLTEPTFVLDYPARHAALERAGIALWDTVASAHRKGSLDSAIRGAEHAPLAELVASLPHLRAVGFNGRKSAAIGRPQLADSGLALIDLPSSSPAYAAMPLAEKERLWARLADFLCLGP
jgi:hypoxanthine-DNA glycosylase